MRLTQQPPPPPRPPIRTAVGTADADDALRRWLLARFLAALDRLRRLR